MEIQLRQYIVAFIDLLGFTSMVTHDCESPSGDHKYFKSLYECHQETKGLCVENPELQLLQFSDSIILALPYTAENFTVITNIISSYQYRLLEHGILCRGGISYGKHYFTEGFLFSKGMIEAYKIESEVAKSPRVVISNDLIDLVQPKHIKQNNGCPLILEHDGSWFIDYLHLKNPVEAWKVISSILSTGLSDLPSVRSKQIWLIDYYNFIFPTHKQEIYQMFTR